MKKTLILSVLIFSPPVFAHDLDNHKIHGFISTNLAAKTVSGGALWYMQTRHRIPIVFSDNLRPQTLATIAAMRELLNSAPRPTTANAAKPARWWRFASRSCWGTG